MRLPDGDPEKPTTPLAMGCSRAGLRAVIFKDSFFNALVPFVSEHFSQVVYLSRPYRQEDMEQIIEQARPDLVIEERAERRIHDLPDDQQG